MLYVFFTSVAIYLVLVTACNASQKKDICFTGLRLFIGAAALLALAETATGWDAHISSAVASSWREPVSAVVGSAEMDSRPANVRVKYDKSSSEHRLMSRLESFRSQGVRNSRLLSPEAGRKTSPFREEDRTQIAARTALLGLLLRQVGK